VLHFEVKSKNTFKDDAVGQVDIDVDEYVLQKNQDTTVKLSDGGSLTLKKTTPVSFRLYARYAISSIKYSNTSSYHR